MFESLKSQFILNFVDDERWRYLVNGLANTLKITFASVVLGIIIGTDTMAHTTLGRFFLIFDSLTDSLM